MKEFENYYKNHLNMSTSLLDSYKKRPNMSMTSAIVGSDGLPKDVFTHLIDNRIIYLSDNIYPEVTNIIKAQLLYLDEIGNEDISLYIDSGGGEVYTGLCLIDIMNYVNSDISTVNMGVSASMGAMILTSGTIGKRKTLKHARTMIHQPMGGAWGQATDLEINVKEINKCKKDLYKILVKQTGQSYEKIESDADRDYWLIGKEAKKYGLVDIVI